MNFFKFLSVLLVAVTLFSCSPTENPPTDTNNPDPTPSPYYFNFKHNGAPFIHVMFPNNLTATKLGDTFRVSNLGDDGMYCDFFFNEDGHFVSSKVYSNGQVPTFINKSNYFNFSSHYFDYDIISIDETNMTIKGTFSGKLYENEFDLNSNFDVVEGDFFIPYIILPEETPTIYSNQGLSVKINNSDWHSVKRRAFGYAYYYPQREEEFFYDDQVKIAVGLDVFASPVGIYTFSNATAGNYIRVSKFNTTTLTYEDYNTSGTVEILNRVALMPPGYLYEGKFNGTATNPTTGEILQLTDGAFKFIFSGR